LAEIDVIVVKGNVLLPPGISKFTAAEMSYCGLLYEHPTTASVITPEDSEHYNGQLIINGNGVVTLVKPKGSAEDSIETNPGTYKVYLTADSGDEITIYESDCYVEFKINSSYAKEFSAVRVYVP
jgi:hypothetical protein